MTPFRKLFLAVAIVATGLGVAILLGEPLVFEQVSTAVKPSVSPLIPITAAPVEPAPLGAWVANGARLVPEKIADLPTAMTSNVFQAPALQSHLASLPSSPGGTGFDSITPRPLPLAEMTSARPSVEDVPRASLRLEAPRPVGNEPRSPATIRRTPALALSSIVSSASDGANSVQPSPPASNLYPAGFASDAPPMSATNASYAAPSDSLSMPFTDQPADPAPWIAEDEAKGPRLHVVVDGDSLAKLAARYLDDPRRGAEIYELNRELLANPELLPIGTELKIPDPEARTSWDKQSRRIGIPYDDDVRQATHGGRAPRTPMSSGQAVIPRARLSRPMPVEFD